MLRIVASFLANVSFIQGVCLMKGQLYPIVYNI